jgi:hypothetical protein
VQEADHLGGITIDLDDVVGELDRVAEYHKEEGSHVASHFHKRAAAKHRQALAAYAELRPQLGLPPEDDRSAKSELEYNLPPVPEGHNRHTHFTNEGSVPNILKHGLRYGLHLGETTDAHGEDAASAIKTLKTRKAGNLDRSRFDGATSEGRSHPPIRS